MTERKDSVSLEEKEQLHLQAMAADPQFKGSTVVDVKKRSFPEMDLDSIFKFGKYKDCEVEDIIEDDPGYIRWLMENEVATFTAAVHECVARRNERRGR